MERARASSARRWRRRSPSRQEDRRLFELVFDRWFFRAAELEAIERERAGEAEGDEGGRGEGGEPGDGDRIDVDELTEMIRQAIADGDEARMRDLAQLAVAAFGRRGEGSGVVGVDVQRIRRSLGLTPGSPTARRPTAPARTSSSTATASAGSSRTCDASSSAG